MLQIPESLDVGKALGTFRPIRTVSTVPFPHGNFLGTVPQASTTFYFLSTPTRANIEGALGLLHSTNLIEFNMPRDFFSQWMQQERANDENSDTETQHNELILRSDRTGKLYPHVQTLSISDLDGCVALENACFSEEERCTREKVSRLGDLVIDSLQVSHLARLLQLAIFYVPMMSHFGDLVMSQSLVMCHSHFDMRSASSL